MPMRSLSARTCALLLLAGPPVATLAIACGGDDPESEPPVGIDVDPEPLFRAVQDDLIRSCGGTNGSCHVRGEAAPRWLGDPDPYLSAKAYRGILPATQEPGDSILLTQVDHVGPSLRRFPELYRRTADWLGAEVPSPPLPNTGAFSVASGYNSINLNTMAEGLDGARLTFLATDGATGTMMLSAIRFFAPQNADVKITAPFFVILPRNGKVKAEPDKNGFKGELTVPAGTSAEFFDGRIIMTQWDPQGQMKIVFSTITSTPGQGKAPGCTALQVFIDKALPAMRMQVEVTDDDDNEGGVRDGGVIGTGSCIGCHAAAADPTTGPTSSVLAMDLRTADTDPAVACGFARNHINFQNKAQSILLLNPMGQANPNHPIKPLLATDPIIRGLEEWVQAEQQ